MTAASDRSNAEKFLGFIRSAEERRFELRTRVEDSSLVAEFHGELDISSAGEVLTLLPRVEEIDAPHVVFDLRQLQFIDSTGIHALITLNKVIDLHDGALEIVCGGSAVVRTFKLAGVDRVLNFTDARLVLPD